MTGFPHHPLARTVMAVALASGVCAAADPPGFGKSDSVQLLCKSALDREPNLRSLNLLVSVQDGVALVAGGVPNGETATKIESVLSRVPGVTVVRVTTWVAPPDDPIKKRIADKLAGTDELPRGDRLAVPHLAVTPVLPGSLPASVPPLPDNPDPSRPSGTIVVQRIEPGVSVGLLQPPVVVNNGSTRLPAGIEVPPPPSGPVGYPTIRATRVPVSPAEPAAPDVAQILLDLRRKDARFSGLVVTLREGTATVTGSASNRADADDFAKLLKDVTGIDRVTVGSIAIR